MTALTIAHTVKEQHPLAILGRMANRHGLIAGATGTGKTVTLRKMAETFSNAGVPVFLVDAKGDLSGMTRAGDGSGLIGERMAQLGLGAGYLCGSPVRFWDTYGESGIPLRLSIDEIGPMLLARIMDLSEAQEGALAVVFRVAADNGWEMIDLRDLRAMITYVADNSRIYQRTYGNVTPATIGAIQRQLLLLENEGAERFFGEPSLDLNHWLTTAADGRGIVNILNAEKLLLRAPRIYSTFLIWFLTRLREILPECGDPPLPKLVLFFDEAHLLFENPSITLQKKIETTVRLIRSKGVGVYFITQSPLDLPEKVLDQLNNRIQHALRAFTPKAIKNVEAVAKSFRPNPTLDTEQAITELGKGEALVSFLDGEGIPHPVQRACIMPPQSDLAPLSDAERNVGYQNDPLYPVYRDTIERPTAYEALQALTDAEATENSVEDPAVRISINLPPDNGAPVVPSRPATAAAANSTPAATPQPITTTKIPLELVRGQNTTLPATSQLRIRLHWPQAATAPDISLFLLGADGKVRDDGDILYYNQPITADGSIRLDGDTITICPATLNTAISELHLCASIDDTSPYRSLSEAGEAVLCIRDENGGEHIRYRLTPHEAGIVTALSIAQLYRRHGQWKIRARSEGYRDGLAKLCEHYGLEVQQ